MKNNKQKGWIHFNQGHKNMKKITVLFLVVSLLNLFVFSNGSKSVQAADTSLSQVMSAGTLSVSASSSIAFGGLTVSTSNQTATTTISGTAPINTIGSGAGWSMTMTMTNLATRGTAYKLAGDNDTVSFSGTYDGTPGINPNSGALGTFNVEITTGGAVGVAVFSWIGPTGVTTSSVSTASSVVLGHGISVNFSAATYVVGDTWEVGVDVFPYTSLTATPGSVSAVSGVTNGMSAGSSGAFSGSSATSAARTLLTADYHRGMGSYTQPTDLSQSVHANSLAGTYSSEATITVL